MYFHGSAQLDDIGFGTPLPLLGFALSIRFQFANSISDPGFHLFAMQASSPIISACFHRL